MVAVKDFVIASVPFVVIEAATEIVSFATGQLLIPPLVGVGMLVDAAILVAGLVVALVRSLGRKSAT